MTNAELHINPVDALIGVNARRLRISKQLEIQEIAEKVGISPNKLIACEEGAVRFGAMDLYRLSRTLGVNVSEFFDKDVLKGVEKLQVVN